MPRPDLPSAGDQTIRPGDMVLCVDGKPNSPDQAMQMKVYGLELPANGAIYTVSDVGIRVGVQSLIRLT